MIVIAFNASTLTIQAKGKSKTYHYLSCMTGQKSSDSSIGDIYKIKLKNNKLTIWGSFTRYTDKDYSGFKNGKYISYKKKTFTLSKNVKFYGAGGEMAPQKLSKKKFKEYLKWNGNGLGFRMVVKNNKVVKIIFES